MRREAGRSPGEIRQELVSSASSLSNEPVPGRIAPGVFDEPARRFGLLDGSQRHRHFHCRFSVRLGKQHGDAKKRRSIFTELPWSYTSFLRSSTS